jgi:hypothetical protein
LADAVEHSAVAETAQEVIFTTSKMFQMFLKDPALEATVKRVVGRPVRLTIKIGTVEAAAPMTSAAPKPAQDTETTERALSHPEVKRFQEMFPDAQLRTVRNLKENQ